MKKNLKNIWNFIKFSFKTIHKQIGTLYLLLGGFSGLIRMILSILIQKNLGHKRNFIVKGILYMYNAVITSHSFIIIIFFMVMPIVIGGFGDWFIPNLIGVPDMAFPRLYNLSFYFLPWSFYLLVTSMFMSKFYGLVDVVLGFFVWVVEIFFEGNFIFTVLFSLKIGFYEFSNNAVGLFGNIDKLQFFYIVSILFLFAQYNRNFQFATIGTGTFKNGIRYKSQKFALDLHLLFIKPTVDRVASRFPRMSSSVTLTRPIATGDTTSISKPFTASSSLPLCCSPNVSSSGKLISTSSGVPTRDLRYTGAGTGYSMESQMRRASEFIQSTRSMSSSREETKKETTADSSVEDQISEGTKIKAVATLEKPFEYTVKGPNNSLIDFRVQPQKDGTADVNVVTRPTSPVVPKAEKQTSTDIIEKGLDILSKVKDIVG